MANQFVLMADIIKSRLQTPTVMMQGFKNLASVINSLHKEDSISPITITLGDEFQAVAKSLKGGVKIIISFEEEIIKEMLDFKMRYVLCYGDIQTPLNTAMAYGMLGPGLSDARRRLDEMKRSEQRFCFCLGNENMTKKFSNMFLLYQFFVDKWKPKSFPIVSEFLKESDYKAVAKTLDRDPSLIWKRKKSLKIKEYLALKTLIELSYE